MFDVWKNVLAEIEQKTSRELFITYFSTSNLVSIQEKIVTIGARNVFLKKQYETKYYELIKKALENNNIEVDEIIAVVQSENSKTRKSGYEVREDEPKRRGRPPKKLTEQPLRTFQTGLNAQYTLDNFVVGSNNDLAVSVAKNVVKAPGMKTNPFFLYGGPGLGKTHLIQAIGNEILHENPNLKVLYIPINRFYADFISAINHGNGDKFSERFRKLDVLIVDDIQMIEGKDRSQEEFFNIFNDLYQLNKQIVVASDRLPDQIKKVDERLASRLAWGGAIDLQLPSFEDKCAILRAKADFQGVEIEDEAIEYLAENVTTNIRDLEAGFAHLMAIADWKAMSPLEVINDGYARPQSTNKRQAVTAKAITEKVAKSCGITVKEMVSKSRVSHIKTARQIAMYLLSKELSMSTQKIAGEVGVKDHTTVMHGIKKIEDDLKLDFGLREKITSIREELYE